MSKYIPIAMNGLTPCSWAVSILDAHAGAAGTRPALPGLLMCTSQ